MRNELLAGGVEQYIVDTTVREHPVLAELHKETSTMSGAGMQIGSDQGQFMGLLARAIGAKRYLEIGVFTGYSSLAMALALPDDGRVVACDVSEEYTSVAKRYWQKAGVEKKIDLRLGPAVATLDKMIADKVEPFDIAFIDADKANYDAYYERCLQLVRPGGLILCDNMLWSGAVIDKTVHDADTDALRALNAKAGKDERVDVSLLSVGDGILIARKR
ncbi:MAG TPA: class I SAM-dependent methyltransferase [Candidatus Acidoferrales bacterium]|jgi:predicted O-methyltransferase YrrM|nr:class I SAM-dependent methyltransferase [Candidatus Acidoferrales bacterium]